MLAREHMDDVEYIKTTTELGKFLKSKDTLYGHAVFNMINEYGMDYALSKMEEKLYRLKQLKKLNKMNHSESFTDSLKDIMGYATLTLLYMQKVEELEESAKTKAHKEEIING